MRYAGGRPCASQEVGHALRKSSAMRFAIGRPCVSQELGHAFRQESDIGCVTKNDPLRHIPNASENKMILR